MTEPPKNLTDLLKGLGPGEFQPVPVCFEDGKRIEWYWTNDSFYAEPQYWDGKWIGDIYKKQETNEIVGIAIHLEAIRGAKVVMLKPSKSPRFAKPGEPACPNCKRKVRVKPGQGRCVRTPLWQCKSCFDAGADESEWSNAVLQMLNNASDGPEPDGD